MHRLTEFDSDPNQDFNSEDEKWQYTTKGERIWNQREKDGGSAFMENLRNWERSSGIHRKHVVVIDEGKRAPKGVIGM